MLYEDEKTGFTVRPLNLDITADLKLFIKANENIVNEARLCPDFPLEDPFHTKFWSVYSEIGWGMLIEYQNPKEKGYVIMKGNEAIGTGWVSEYTVGLGWKPDRIQPDYCYPTVTAYELKSPWTKLSAQLHYVIARRVKSLGYERIFVFLLIGHPINKGIKIKREIGRQHFIMSVAELDI